MKKSDIKRSNRVSAVIAAFIGCGVALGHTSSWAGNGPSESRARPFEATFPFYQSEPVSCPEHFLDGVTVSAMLTVKGVEHNAGFLTPWTDAAGGEHLQQIASKLTIHAMSDDMAYEWVGKGRGKFSYQGGANGDGGVVKQYQTEYYHAQGGYPDLAWNLNFVMVVDAKGNVRVLRGEDSGGPRLQCVED